MLDAPMVYPSLAHVVTSLLPEPHRRLGGRLLNVLYDLIAILAVYLTAELWLARELGEQRIGPLSPSVAIALLFATMPVLFPVSARLKAAGGRVLGSTLGVLYLLALGRGMLEQSLPGYFLATLLFVAIVTASKFALQAVLFFSLLLSAFTLSPAPLLVVLAGLAVGSLVPALHVPLLLRGQLAHLAWYWKNRTRTPLRRRNRPRELARLPRTLLANPRRALELCFQELTPIIALVSVPVLAWWIGWAAWDPRGVLEFLASTPETRFLALVNLAALVTFAVTSIPPFTIFGQAERYFVYSAPMLAMLSVGFVARSEAGFAPLFWLFVVQLGGICLHFLYAARHSIAGSLDGGREDGFEELVAFLRDRPASGIVSLPTKLSFRLAPRLPSPEQRFYYDFLLGDGRDMSYMSEATPVYSVPRLDLDYFERRFGLGTFVVQKSQLPLARAASAEYALDASRKLFENAEYAVYRIAPAPGSAEDPR